MTNEKMPGQLSTITGSLLSIVVTLDAGDLIKSIILGAVGTLVSYGVSRLMKLLFEKKAQ